MKRNATTIDEYTKYVIKEQEITRKNNHCPLQKVFVDYLDRIGVSEPIQDEDYIDVQFDLNNKHYICELKPTSSQNDIKYAVRLALGQILWYGFKRGSKQSIKIIVISGKPEEENEEFLNFLNKERAIKYLYRKNEEFLGNIDFNDKVIDNPSDT